MNASLEHCNIRAQPPCTRTAAVPPPPQDISSRRPGTVGVEPQATHRLPGCFAVTASERQSIRIANLRGLRDQRLTASPSGHHHDFARIQTDWGLRQYPAWILGDARAHRHGQPKPSGVFAASREIYGQVSPGLTIPVLGNEEHPHGLAIAHCTEVMQTTAWPDLRMAQDRPNATTHESAESVEVTRRSPLNLPAQTPQQARLLAPREISELRQAHRIECDRSDSAETRSRISRPRGTTVVSAADARQRPSLTWPGTASSCGKRAASFGCLNLDAKII